MFGLVGDGTTLMRLKGRNLSTTFFYILTKSPTCTLPFHRRRSSRLSGNAIPSSPWSAQYGSGLDRCYLRDLPHLSSLELNAFIPGNDFFIFRIFARWRPLRVQLNAGRRKGRRNRQNLFQVIKPFIYIPSVKLYVGHDHDRIRSSPVAGLDRHGFHGQLRLFYSFSVSICL